MNLTATTLTTSRVDIQVKPSCSSRILYNSNYGKKQLIDKNNHIAIKGNAKQFEMPKAVSRQDKFKQAQEEK